MPNVIANAPPQRVKPINTIESIMAQYKADESQDKINLLLLGAIESGKTTALSTMPGPILIISFDPSGTKSIVEQMAFRKDIVVSTVFEGLTEENARVNVLAWEAMLMEMHRSGEINKFKTVCIDSYTTMTMMYEWHQGMKDQTKNGKLPTRNDYQHINRYVMNVVGKFCSGQYHFIMTGHLSKSLEEATGKIMYQLEAYPSMQNKLPIMFDYCFIMQQQETSTGIKHVLITHNPLFAAKKRSSKLNNVELPNLTNIMKKMGWA